MDTKKIIQTIGSGFAGFLVLLGAHGALLLAALASLDILGSSRISPLTWFLLIVVIPPLVTLASVLPSIVIGISKRTSLITGFVAYVFALFIITHPIQESGGLFDISDTLASVTLIGIPMLAISFSPSENRQRRVSILLAVWVIFLILGLVVASFSQIGAGLAVLLAWLVLPATAAALQPYY